MEELRKDVQGKLKETADTFVKCDQIRGEIKAMTNVSDLFTSPGVPAAAAGPAQPAPPGLLQTQLQFDLLRTRLDDMQVSVNILCATPAVNDDVRDMAATQVAMQVV